MGIYNRDYVRGASTPQPFGGGSTAPVVKWVIIANGAVFLLQLLTQYEPAPGVRSSYVTEWLALQPAQLLGGQIWRLVTYAFCHAPGNLLHIIFNMLFLWWFGRTLERMYGSREFLSFYLVAAVLSGLCFVALGLWLGDPAPAIGASGAVMAVVVVYAMYFPRQRIYIWGIFPIEIWLLVALYVAFDLFPVLQSLAGGVSARDGVAHSAHLGGLAFGFLYKTYDLRLSPMWAGLTRFRLPRIRWKRPNSAQRAMRIHRPSQDNFDPLDEQVDAILQKIHDEGEASLTQREREILKSASRRYKKRS